VATDDKIGVAEAYKSSIAFAHNAARDGGSLWLANMNANIQNTV
jgi:hypothetical protein